MRVSKTLVSLVLGAFICCAPADAQQLPWVGKDVDKTEVAVQIAAIVQEAGYELVRHSPIRLSRDFGFLYDAELYEGEDLYFFVLTDKGVTPNLYFQLGDPRTGNYVTSTEFFGRMPSWESNLAQIHGGRFPSPGSGHYQIFIGNDGPKIWTRLLMLAKR